jgi:hypothetical protein
MLLCNGPPKALVQSRVAPELDFFQTARLLERLALLRIWFHPAEAVSELDHHGLLGPDQVQVRSASSKPRKLDE